MYSILTIFKDCFHKQGHTSSSTVNLCANLIYRLKVKIGKQNVQENHFGTVKIETPVAYLINISNKILFMEMMWFFIKKLFKIDMNICFNV